ncbi:MAG: methionyl-tRNA formyltransferase [Bacteroidetes bacterium]|jgi:methionyl-tRNA formyltransferase|nr:methionyl-tRNA formyltransferase [Bacteroidota bacterium]
MNPSGKKARIVFFGTPEFAASQLKAIFAAEHQVAAVVTAPDKPAGRGKKIQQSAVKQLAEKLQLKVLQPLNLKDPDFIQELRQLEADIFVVVAFRMLPELVWSMPPRGTFNLHASLLPNYRGAAPINWAIINGEKETGLTTFFINEKIDEGKLILQQEMMIGPDENAGSLHDRMMHRGNALVTETIQLILAGNPKLQPQPESAMLKPAPKIYKPDCAIQWQLPINKVYNQIRGLSPYPTAYTDLINEEGKVLRIKVYDAKIEKEKPEESPLSLLTDNKTFLKVALADGYLVLLNIQLPGKKNLKTSELLKGFKFEGKWQVFLEK